MQTKHDSGGLESAIFTFIRVIYIGKPSVVLDNSVPTVLTFRRDEDTVRQKLARYERLLKRRSISQPICESSPEFFQTTKVLRPSEEPIMCVA